MTSTLQHTNELLQWNEICHITIILLIEHQQEHTSQTVHGLISDCCTYQSSTLLHKHKTFLEATGMDLTWTARTKKHGKNVKLHVHNKVAWVGYIITKVHNTLLTCCDWHCHSHLIFSCQNPTATTFCKVHSQCRAPHSKGQSTLVQTASTNVQS